MGPGDEKKIIKYQIIITFLSQSPMEEEIFLLVLSQGVCRVMEYEFTDLSLQVALEEVP